MTGGTRPGRLPLARTARRTPPKAHRHKSRQPYIQSWIARGKFTKVVVGKFKKDRIAQRHNRGWLNLIGENSQFSNGPTLGDFFDDPLCAAVFFRQYPKATAHGLQQAAGIGDTDSGSVVDPRSLVISEKSTVVNKLTGSWRRVSDQFCLDRLARLQPFITAGNHLISRGNIAVYHCP